MKKPFVLGLAFLAMSSITVCAEEQKPNADVATMPPTTKLEAFLSRKGAIVIRDFHDVGVLAQKVTGSKDNEYAPPKKTTEFYSSENGVEILVGLVNAGTELTKESIESYVSVTALAVYNPGTEDFKTKGLQCKINRYDFKGRSYVASDKSLTFIDLEEARSLSKALDYLVSTGNKWKGQDVGSKEIYFVTKDNFKVGVSQINEKAPQTIFVSSGRVNVTTAWLSSIEDLSKLKESVDNGIAWLEKQ